MEKIVIKYSGNAKLGIYLKKWRGITLSETSKKGKVVLLARDIISKLKSLEYYQIESPEFLELERCLILTGKVSPVEISVIYSSNKNHYETVPINKIKQTSGFHITSEIDVDEYLHVEKITKGDLIITKEEELEFKNELSAEQAVLFEKFQNGSFKKIIGDYYTEGTFEETEKFLKSWSFMDSDGIEIWEKFHICSPVYYIHYELYDNENYYFSASLSEVNEDGYYSMKDGCFNPDSLELKYVDFITSCYRPIDMYNRGSSERHLSKENLYIGEWNNRLYEFLETRDGWQVSNKSHEEISEQLKQITE